MDNNISKCLGFQQVTATSSAFSLTLPSAGIMPSRPRFILVQAETQALRWRDDGIDPTASVGMLIPAGSSIEYAGNLSGLRIINAVAGAIANVSYYV